MKKERKIMGFLPVKIAIPVMIVVLSMILFYAFGAYEMYKAAIISILCGSVGIFWGSIVFIRDILK